jgi:mitochondrial import receptor subunit TOM70
MSNPATDNLVKNADKAPSISDSVRKFLEDKDWKFYTAVGVGAVAVGAGVYYLTRSGSPKPSTKKSRKDASKRGGAKESLSEKAGKAKDALEEKVAEGNSGH